jgi:hypothetical protein
VPFALRKGAMNGAATPIKGLWRMSRLFEPTVDGPATGMMAFVLDRHKRESGWGGAGWASGRRPSLHIAFNFSRGRKERSIARPAPGPQ